MRLSLCGSGHSEGTGPQILTIAMVDHTGATNAIASRPEPVAQTPPFKRNLFRRHALLAIGRCREIDKRYGCTDCKARVTRL